MADLPGGASGLLCRDYKGRRADRLATRIDPGVVLLLAELRGHERQASEELGQWKTGVEEPKPLDASQTAITLAPLLTDERLDSLEKRAGDEKSRGDDQVDQMSQALNRLRGIVRLPKYSRQCRGPRRAIAVGWRDLREWNRAVRGQFTIRRFSIANRQAKDLVAEGEHLPDQLSRNLAVGQLETNKTLPSEVGRYIISPER